MIKNSTTKLYSNQVLTRGTQLLILLSMFVFGNRAQAQTPYYESFDVPAAPPPVFPKSALAFGWAQGKYIGVSPYNLWDRVGVGSTLPNCSPITGNAMMRYNSRLTTAGEQAFLASKRLDMRNNPGTATVSFWMYRDETYTGVNDNIRVYINNSPDMGGTPYQLTVAAINRPCGSTPVVACPVSYNASGWQQYTFTLTNLVSYYNSANAYILILATSALGGNIYIDDFYANTYPNAQSYVTNSAAVVNQNSASTAKGATKQQIIGLKLTMDGATSPLSLTQMIFNTNGSTNPATDITNKKLWYTGGSNTFDTTIATLLGTYGNPVFTNDTFLFAPPAGSTYSGLTSFASLEHGDNYFWITYDIKPGATSGNFVDAEWVSVNISGVGTVSPNPFTLPGAREIDVIYCIPTYFVGTSWLNYNTNDYIAQVILAGNATAPPGINNSMNSVGPNAGGCAGGPCPFSAHPPDYELFAAVPGKTASLTADGTTNYPLSIKVGTYASGNSVAAWIDFNKNGIFEITEKLGQSPSPGLGNSGIYNTTFIVPVGATTGTTRLRVREVWINYLIDPCASATYGETEDYVVTILPTCGVPGWKTWLGFTDDWDNPANWCGGVPTLTDNARLPGTGGPGYYRPVIKPGVFARTKKFRVEANDTLYIKAWNNSDFIVADSMYIQDPTSSVRVISQLIDTAQVSNGLLYPSPALTPLKNSTKARTFWLFSQAELLAKGMVAGDVITDLKLHLNRTASQPFRNVSIKYYYTNPLFVFVPGPTASIPPVVTAGGTIYTAASLNTLALIPTLPFPWGTINFPVAGSFIWNGSPNKLVIELSYDNTSFSNPGGNDQPRYTQTLGFRNYATMINTAVIAIPGASLVPPTTQNATGTSGTNTITVPAATAINIVAGQTAVGAGIPAGATVVSVVGNVVTLSANLTANMSNTPTNFAGNISWTASDYRPNLTFKYDRPFSRYDIEVRGQWGNNGSFVPGFSRVTLKGAVALTVAGASNTSFYDLRIDNANHVTRMTDFTVTDTLTLLNGRLKLNNGIVNLTNNSPAALTRVNGFLQSDQDVIANNTGPYGRLHWNIGSTPGTYLLPFVNAAGSYIPMDYVTTAGTHDVIFATHATNAANLNTPAPITNINGYFTGTDNSANMVDRFYMVDNTAGSGGPVANINFRYANSERAALGNNTMRAQRWMAPSAGWEYPFLPSQNHTVGIPDVVNVPGFNLFSSNVWWAITQNAAPLPVSMLDFTSKNYSDKVKLMWQTASEIDNSHFIVERTTDNQHFDFIGRVESKGPSSSTINYSLWDEQPLQGLQYYYLRQYDINGTMKSYGPVTATFTRDLFDIITATAANSDKGLAVDFDYNSDEPYKYTVIDMQGKVIAQKDKNVATQGRNRIEIDVKLSQGVYQIVLQNSEKVVAKKFYYDKL